MLELYDRKLSRTVLRRESRSNPADLAGTIFGGFAPNSQTAEVLSKAMGSRTVMSGSISKGKNDPSQSLQMIERPLMTPDELKSIPKEQFIVMKTGTHPMQTRLRLFLDWGIQFEEPYQVEEKSQRAVAYASKRELERAILRLYPVSEPESPPVPPKPPTSKGGAYYGRTRRTQQESEMRTSEGQGEP